ncbi:MAG: phosphatidate cytidylyltransferase [Clostridiaceae bacterium]|nr:phosphatidate cytidylyltransferase [Clostridiaceae bacterium]
MKQRIITGVIFTLVIALFIIPGYWSIWPPVVLFTGVAILAAYEIVTVIRQSKLNPSLPMAMAGSLMMLLPLVGSRVFPEAEGILRPLSGFALTAFALLLFMTITVIALLLKRGPQNMPDAVATAAVMAYVAFPLSCPVLLLDQVPGGWLWVVIGLTSPWVSDVFAYFVGSLIGRHPIVPVLSPKKTVEGCLGGIAGCMLSQMLIFHLFQNILGRPAITQPKYMFYALITGLVLSVASQLGDWLASGIKRWCGVKDFGYILPGHGGIMDRFDSAFFTLPITMIMAMLYQILLT